MEVIISRVKKSLGMGNGEGGGEVMAKSDAQNAGFASGLSRKISSRNMVQGSPE